MNELKNDKTKNRKNKNNEYYLEDADEDNSFTNYESDDEFDVSSIYFPITTMSAFIDLDREIDIICLLYWLKILWFNLPQNTSWDDYRKYKSPEKYAILRAAKNEVFRGKWDKVGSFRNAIFMCLTTNSKNLIVKVHKNSIHIMGSRDHYSLLEASENLIWNINWVNDKIDWVNNEADPEKIITILNWVKKNSYEYKHVDDIINNEPFYVDTNRIINILEETKSEETKTTETKSEETKSEETKTTETKEFEIIDEINTVKVLKYPDEYVNGMPNEFSNWENADKYWDLAEHFMSIISDYDNHDDYCKHLDKMLSFGRVCIGEPEILAIKTSMVNHNYNIGFDVRINKFSRMMIELYNNGNTEFIPEYDNVNGSYLTLYLMFDDDEEINNRIRIKEGKDRQLSFKIYPSGSVTQSGPDYILNLQGFVAFCDLIETLKDEIKRDDNNTVFFKLITDENKINMEKDKEFIKNILPQYQRGLEKKTKKIHNNDIFVTNGNDSAVFSSKNDDLTIESLPQPDILKNIL